MSQIIRALYRCAGLMFLLASAACVRQGPSDLTLRNVFLSDWSVELKRWGIVNPPTYSKQAIVLELTSVEPFAPQEPFISEAFCGEKLSPAELGSFDLYVPPERALPDRPEQPVGQARPENPYRYYILIPTWSDRRRNNPQLVDFNLERDDRDICLQTKFMQERYIWLWRLSNEVRVPRQLIDQAFRAGLKPLPAMKPL